MVPQYLAFFAAWACSLALSHPVNGGEFLGETYSNVANVVSSVKNLVGRIGLLRDHSSAISEMNRVLGTSQKSVKELESLLYGFSESVLRYGMVKAASMGNVCVIQALLNCGVVDSNTIEHALISAANGYQWKAFSMLVPFASEDSFKNVPSLEDAYSNISNQKDLFQLVDKTKNYSLILYVVLMDAIRTGKVDVVNAIFIRDAKLLQDEKVFNMLVSYFEDIVSFKELENMDNLKDWIIVHGILVADKADQTEMVRFLLSLIDISTKNNLLLKAASYYNHLDLVNYALKNEDVVRTGLDDAIRLSGNTEIRDILLSAHIFFLIDGMASSGNASPAA